MKYRKKPVEVEAFKMESNIILDRKATKLPTWIENAIKLGKIYMTQSMHVGIETLEGNLVVDEGDYIIQGVKGELYPCKPDIFKMTYEEVL